MSFYQLLKNAYLLCKYLKETQEQQWNSFALIAL